jgi:hypothetical protein
MKVDIMKFASGEQIMLRLLAFVQECGSWICIGAGIILIIAGIVNAVTVQTRRLMPMICTEDTEKRPSLFRTVVCFAFGGVLMFGGWGFVREMSRNMYLATLSLVAERNSDSDINIKNINSISDIPLKEPSVDEVLIAFENSGGILADGFKQSVEIVPDILGSMNKILVRAGLMPVDETIVDDAINAISNPKYEDWN